MKNSQSKQVWSKDTMVLANVFARSIPMQLIVHEVRRALGGATPNELLTVGNGNPLLLHHLRQGPGNWQHVVKSPAEQAAVREVTGVEAALLDWSELPFEDKSFDAVVVIDCLEEAADEEGFIHTCHRALKNDGRLILCTRNRKRLSLLSWLHPGSEESSGDSVRAGYTEKELFLLLKNGFDVIGMRSYQRFLLESVNLWVRAAVRRGRSLEQVYRVASPLFKIAYQLDTLFLLTRGHRWIVVGKRRTWRPRKAPILGDGRTITEAVLSRPSV